MKTTLKLTTLVLGVTLCGLGALAQSEPGERQSGDPAGDERGLPPVLRSLDINRDGRLSEDEIATATAVLKRWEREGDRAAERETSRGPGRRTAAVGGADPIDGPPREGPTRRDRNGEPDVRERGGPPERGPGLAEGDDGAPRRREAARQEGGPRLPREQGPALGRFSQERGRPFARNQGQGPGEPRWAPADGPGAGGRPRSERWGRGAGMGPWFECPCCEQAHRRSGPAGRGTGRTGRGRG